MKMSLEEWKVREELEEEVENDLEREIKDGIYGLTKKLHNLYMHQRERNETKMRQNPSNPQNKRTKSRKTTFSEVKITIKMKGETTIEIKESKKEGGRRGRRFPLPNPPPKQTNVRGNTWTPMRRLPSTRRNKFDWTKSLRSGSGSGSDILNGDSRIENKKRDSIRDNDCMKTTALLEMGWKC